MHLEIPSFNRQISGFSSSTTVHGPNSSTNCLAGKSFPISVDTMVDPLGEQVYASLNDFFQLHVGTPYESAYAIGFQNGDGMTRFVKLIGSSGARTNNGYFLTGPLARRINPAFGKTFVDDRTFDALDSNRRFNDSKDTNLRRALDNRLQLGKIVCLVQAIQCLGHLPWYQIIPFGNQIIDRQLSCWGCLLSYQLTIRRSAIHTAGTLLTKL